MARLGLALVLAAVALSAAQVARGGCPLVYSSDSGQTPAGGLLLGGPLNAPAPKDAATNKPVRRDTGWAQQCKWPETSREFGVCDAQQRQLVLDMARKLRGGAALGAAPCDLFQYIRGRTLWLIGDSHTKQLFKALQCYLYDFWGPDPLQCKVSADEAVVKELDTLPMMPGESKCIHLMGNGRICRVGAVLGSSLVNNTQIANGGVLNTLRRKLADPHDIFVVQFGLWHLLEGPTGEPKLREAVRQLAADYQANKAKWPHLIFRETPMRHDSDTANSRCRPAQGGWGLNYDSGELFVLPNARSDAAAKMARGGAINEPARDLLPAAGVPVMGGYAWSVPLHADHPATRGTGSLDCIHYCSLGLPELLIYEMTRLFKEGATGIRPLPEVPADRRRPCVDMGAWAP